MKNDIGLLQIIFEMLRDSVIPHCCAEDIASHCPGTIAITGVIN